jgi:hypothetical protein
MITLASVGHNLLPLFEGRSWSDVVDRHYEFMNWLFFVHWIWIYCFENCKTELNSLGRIFWVYGVMLLGFAFWGLPASLTKVSH